MRITYFGVCREARNCRARERGHEEERSPEEGRRKTWIIRMGYWEAYHHSIYTISTQYLHSMLCLVFVLREKTLKIWEKNKYPGCQGDLLFTGPHEWNLDRSEDGGWRRREDNTRNVTEELVLQTIIWFHNRFYFTITEKALTHYWVNPRLAKCQSQCLKCESGSSHFQPGEGSSRGSLTMYVFII